MDTTQSNPRSVNVDKHHELRDRTKAFALRVIRMSDALPRTRSGNVIGNQIVRSATGMAANYRAAGRSRSKSEFIAKIGVVIEEADETVFWREMLRDSGIIKPAKLVDLLQEANQLLAIFTASRRTAKS
ncbi:MAG TPA: four helix bundle protein [Candidatus Angelobacter sp.]|nr:four helix bundle protein [Candidatus Angelobacter sp.]